ITRLNYQFQWNVEVIHDLIEHSDIPLIQKVYLPYHPAHDGIIWPYTSDGNYSVKSDYHYITTTQDAEIVPPPLAYFPALTKMIWSAPIPPKLKHFFWKIGSRTVAVKENIRHQHIPVDPTCPRCCDDNESSDHAFFTCLFSQQFPLSTLGQLSHCMEVSISLKHVHRQHMALLTY
ncbi:hypothetical protein HID58_074927, partial [Brassica napus]